VDRQELGIAAKTTSLARCQSIEARKASERLRLVSVAETAMIGTAGSGPTIGTSTKGMSTPAPYPVTALIVEANTAAAAISKSCGIEISSNGDRGTPCGRFLLPSREVRTAAASSESFLDSANPANVKQLSA
jgi:hypothetical protein